MPLMLKTPRIEDQRVVFARHFRRRHMRSCQEKGAAMLRCKGNSGGCPVSVAVCLLADAIVQIANGVAITSRVRRNRPLERTLAKTLIARAANIVAGLGIPEATDLVEDIGGAPIAEGIGIAHRTGDASNDLPIG